MKTLDLKGVEMWREYVFADGHVYRIDSPTTVYIADSGSHRVLDAHGITHYLSGWRVIRWVGDVIA